MLGTQQIPKSMASKVSETYLLRKDVADSFAGSLRQDNLSAVTAGQEPSKTIQNWRSIVSLRIRTRAPSVDRHTHPNWFGRVPVLGHESPLGFGGGQHGVDHGWES